MLYSEKSLMGGVEHIQAPDPLEVCTATSAELETIIAGQSPEEAGISRSLLAGGSECLIAWRGEAMAGYSWVDRQQVVLLGNRVSDLPEEGAYTFNSYVWPDFRGRKVFQVLTESVYRLLAEEGFSFCCNLVDRNNAGSIGARKKFSVVTQPAPILKLPGLDPRPVNGPLPWGLSLAGRGPSDPIRTSRVAP
jgi:hypothetical protein